MKDADMLALADELQSFWSDCTDGSVEHVVKRAADYLRLAARPSPAGPVDREAVARVIDPTAKFENLEGVQWSRFDVQRRDDAFEKADAILALLQPAAGPGEPVAVKRWYVRYDGYGHYFVSQDERDHVVVVYDEDTAEKIADRFNEIPAPLGRDPVTIEAATSKVAQ